MALSTGVHGTPTSSASNPTQWTASLLRQNESSRRTDPAVEIPGGSLGSVGLGGHSPDHQVVDAVAIENLRNAGDVRTGLIR